ncbi:MULTISPECIES: ABC transporter ATP-binding protein [Rhizobium/Agrobacterium group]|uniref:ABC transporter ATP-binding protein n=1 Tax=Rhizobium/Agrobacterium group TaxID=227290 RepID=UPI000B3FA881|nr:MULTISPECIES: sn-glycerol-3-phosphate ABC transporter ATP-binding protein UgpC [Rhizobium/Agrobacterium group]MCF1481332.1 sn-glycerol-3-phosphate ABC transporter ATP-binding protein UgpC [Allorhizobium ampelinum]NSZ45184.1 sn-glycerol-3-phosphate ABC transporter ATP-binding protein UgpC [Agrobacterium vitis]NTA28931.1 sn-glycerol-3-phosphate ABC transporter ATP-binding protein UgpC [Allorhizobium ampelinum]OVE90880.1 ABC transporter [Allorhizobium ampelinum]
MGALQLKDLNKSYGAVKVLHDIDLTIEDGEFVVFVGPSGCGKSTLLRIIAGLEDVTTGAINIDGRDVSQLSPAERKIAMVFQSYALYPHMSVRKNLAFGLENLKFKRAEIEARIAEAARMLAIEPYLDRKPRQLSGGQRQRVAIGRAIVREPEIFLFDEPLSNLDAALRVQTRAEITRLHRDIKTTMIYVTHDQVEAMTMADKIVVLKGGRVEQVGTPLDLFNNPCNLFVAGFLGSPRMNMLKGRIVGFQKGEVLIDVGYPQHLTASVDEAAAKPGQEVMVGIRPAHFQRVETGGLPFVVGYCESLGTETYLYGRMEGQEEQVILHQPGHFVAPEDSRLVVAPLAGTVHVFDPVSGLTLTRHRQQVSGGLAA